MPRKPRFAPAGYYLHIVQRGNYRQRTFHSPGDHAVFQNLISYHADAHAVDLLGYCQMSNHFHLIARSERERGISAFMQGVNGQYAQYFHGRFQRRGRLWQGRYYSCVLSHTHLFAALRYIELNPVRAGLVDSAVDYPWSSAQIHTHEDPVLGVPHWLDTQTLRGVYTAAQWKESLAAGQDRSERAAIRRATQSELPLGNESFVGELEAKYGLVLRLPTGQAAIDKKPARMEPGAARRASASTG